MIPRRLNILLFVAAIFGLLDVWSPSHSALAQSMGESLTVMTFNVRRSDLYGWDTAGAVWYDAGAVNGGSNWLTMERGDAAARTIINSGADVVGLQEYTNGQDLVNRIQAINGQQWFYASTSAGGIMSRLPILETSPANHGARIELPSGVDVWVFNVHFGLDPNWEISYIPYNAANGLYAPEDIPQLIRDLDNWVTHLAALQADMASVLSPDEPVIFTGDFNEPSHLDWTDDAANAGYIPFAVDCPLSNDLLDLGFRDGYHDDRIQDGETEVSRFGYTWTSDGAGHRDDDRIDFVMYRGEGVGVLDSQLIGDANGSGLNGSDDVDLKVWWDNGSLVTVSDHRAVAVTFSIESVVYAESMQAIRGLQISGDLSDASQSDDLYVKFIPGLTLNPVEPPVWLIFDATLPNHNPPSLSVILEASANTINLQQTIEMYNWNTNSFEQIDAQNAALDDVVVTVDVSSKMTDYIQTGTAAVQTRVGWRGNGPVLVFPWTICIDQIIWAVQ